MSAKTVVKLQLSKVAPNPNQPRKYFDEESLRELADSIVSDGLKSPILVRPVSENYEIVQGERRYRASKLAGLETIEAFIEEISEEDAFHLAVIENIQREQLTPIEEARAFMCYVEMGFTHDQIAKKISKSRTYVTSRLRLLKLIPEIQDWIAEGRISEGHAKQILKVEGVTDRLCGENFFSKGSGVGSFERFQFDFISKFDKCKKISVNDVSDWADELREFLLYPMIAVFNGHIKAVMGSAKDFDITARGYCILFDLQIQNILNDDIEFLLNRALMKEHEISDGAIQRWEIYKIYDDLKERMFKDGQPEWPEEERARRGRKFINETTGKFDNEAFDECWSTLFIDHENVSRDTIE